MKVLQEFTFVRCREEENHVKKGEVEEVPIQRLIDSVLILERLDSNSYSIFTWPSSILLSLYLTTIAKGIENKIIFEIGAGTALPSIVCGKLKARKVFSSDRAEETDILNNIEKIITLNHLQEAITVLPFNWGHFSPFSSEQRVDLIIGADVFYSSEDFDDLLFSISDILQHSSVSSPSSSFITAYQIRSSNRSIFSCLKRYGLEAEIISKEFVSTYHFQRECSLMNRRTKEITSQRLVSFEDIVLLKIYLNRK